MPSAYLESLKKNRDGKHVMPYHVGWNDRLWKDQASEFVLFNEIENQIYELGGQIGRRCADLWQTVDAIVAKYAGPNIVRLILDAANIAWVGIKRQEEKTKHLSVRERYRTIKSTVTEDPEVLTDLISEFLFYTARKGITINTTLELPHFHPPSYAELSDSAALIAHIEEVGYYKFLFDRCVYLEGKIGLDETQISISSAASEKRGDLS